MQKMTMTSKENDQIEEDHKSNNRRTFNDTIHTADKRGLKCSEPEFLNDQLSLITEL